MATFKSQTPLLQPAQKTKKTWRFSNNSMHHKNIQKSNLSIDNWKNSSRTLPNYRKMPNKIFIHRLSKSIPSQCAMIRQLLTNNTAMLHFIRHRALLMCTLSELKIEEDYWKHVADVAMPTVRWLSQTFKDIMKRNFINWDYPRTEHNIRHRQRLIDNKL
ncbi:unnamed protein product [Rotaria sordida]|uniref:Uncharacterized protein n=2 Tax=Rotaria sordida TaxID=392033 RepID=A0A815PWT4_9BILA|nr:unnamed protein product [Rotaria sordida]CAF4229496.1 unnamed protein product [Rotaria sordida]